MSTKYKIIVISAGLLTSFAFGRYTAPKQPDVHTVATVQTDEKKDTVSDDHKKTVIVKTPDGTTTTTITDEDLTTIADVTDTSSHVDTTITQPKVNTLNLNVLAGTQVYGSKAFQPIYGLSVTKQVLGPVTVGGWALSNSTIGVSLGLEF